MATIEDFILRMKVEGQNAIRQTSNSVQVLKDDFNNLGQASGNFGNTINSIIGRLGPLGVAASITGSALAAMGLNAVRISGEMQDIAGSTGISTGVINSFATSMIFAGGKAEDAAGILQRLNQSVQEAASGNENLQKSFQTLGVFVTDANGKIRPTQDILQDLTARFQSGELSAGQFTASVDILGRSVRALELQNLSAVDDPAYTAATANLDKLNDILDVISTTIKTKTVIAFGEFAKSIVEGGISGGLAKITEEIGYLTAGLLNLPTDSITALLNLFGAGIKNPVGLGDPVKNLVDQAKRERLRLQEENVKLEELKKQQAKIAQQGVSVTTAPAVGAAGGFGATPEATVKAREENLKRIKQFEIEQARQTQLGANAERLSILLQFADQETAITQKNLSAIKDIEINAQTEILKAKLEIYKQERLSKEELDKEYAAKEKEIQLKAAADIARVRGQLSEQLSREEQRIQDIITQSKARVEEETRLNDVLSQRNKFSIDNATATDKERERAQKLFDLEEERLKVLRQIALIKDIPPAERAAREQEINNIFAQRKQLTVEQQDADRNLQRDFASGFEKAYKQYVEDARDNFAIAGRLFQSMTQGMEDAFVNFAKTGKFEFKNFVNLMLEELLRSQVRQLMASLFMGSNSSKSSRGLLGGKIIPGILAGGGPVSDRRPYIVGEQGPEMFIPNSAGSMMPNRDLVGSTSVTYNIQAVDAMSFKQLVARDPGFLYAVTEQGRRTAPQTRR
jgi:lambda family phage tail tape measure protein